MTTRFSPPARLALACLCTAALLLASLPARADTPIALFKSYAGRLNFTGVQKTMRTASNTSNACAVSNSTTLLTAKLAGIPAAATIVSAHLYWAGSSSTPDYSIIMDGATLTAPANRQFTTATIGYDYFSGAIDVTAQVTAKRNADYKLSGLTINNGSPYCGVEGVIGGFSLLAIYSLPTETFRVLNLYEGFQYIRTYGSDNIKVSLNLSNFKTPTPLGSATGRIAHVTWEGDSSLSGGGENLKFNGAEMVDTANPTGNQFNSTSNIGGTVDSTSYGIDFDAYLLASPKLFAGQTTATMLYESGQDMVLLNAEVVAVPNVDVADLSVTLTSSGTPARGNDIGLIHTVSNQGPLPDAGPITVKTTLANGLVYVSGAGTGWTCSVSGQVVTCTYGATLAVGASAPALTITATISLAAPGTMTSNTSVGGLQFDNDTSNNSASKTISFSSAKYKFTDSKCNLGIVPGTPGQCNYLSMPTLQAALAYGQVYVTATDNTVTDPTFKTVLPPSSSVNLYFSVKCVNPTSGAGVLARFKNVALKACVANSAAQSAAQWQVIAMSFASGASSTAAMPFVYADVGLIELLMSETASALAATSSTGQFVVRPVKFALSTPLSNPAGGVTAGDMSADIGRFWKAGAGFTLDIIAQNYDGAATPNFGKETSPQKVELVTTPAIDPLNLSDPADPDSEALPFADMTVEAGTDFPTVEGAFPAFSSGAASSAAFTFAEVGIINVYAHMAGGTYLGTEEVTSNVLPLGRFYPNHFQTAVPVVISCAAPHPLNCGALGLHYSKQPIRTVVSAYNAVGAITTFYQGKFVKTPKLLPYIAPGTAANGTTQASMGTLMPSLIVEPEKLFFKGVGSTTPSFDLTETPAASAWYAPVDIYLRATDADLVTSHRSALSVEGGTRIARGRLLVENAFGSELLALPVTMRAQYWTGTSASNGRWADSTTDNISIVAPPAVGSGVVTFNHSVTSNLLSLTFTQCKKAMSTCSAGAPVFPDPKATLGSSLMVGGLVRFKFAPTGKVGSVDVGVNGPVWLPNAPGRLTFGVYKSTPLIYIREIF